MNRNEREEIKAILGLTGLSYEPNLPEAIKATLRGHFELLDAAKKALIWFEAFQPSFPPSTAVGSTVEGTIEILREAIAQAT